MRILVTGGAGFIGSTIAQQCVAAGHEVVVYDNLSTGSLANVPAEAELIEGDVRDGDRLLKVFKGFDVVAHQAARVSVPDSIADPAGFWDANVIGTRCVLEAARLSGVRRVVLASTAAIYGPGTLDAAREEDAPRPASPYAYNKWRNELEAAYCGQQLGLEFIEPPGPRRAAIDRLLALLHGLRPAPAAGLALRGRGLDPERAAAQERAAHDLRHRPADARLRLRRGRGAHRAPLLRGAQRRA